MTNPDEIKAIAEQKLAEAKHLLAGGFNEGAYYLAGYCVELYLKARICEVLGLDDLFVDAEASVSNQASPSNREIGKVFKIHDLPKLVLLAGLSQKLEAESTTNPFLLVNWSVLKDWRETKRYARPGSISRQAVELHINAIENPQNGFVTWIQRL